MIRELIPENGDNEVVREKLLDSIIASVALGMGVYHLANCYLYILGSIDHVMLHLAFALVLIFLTSAKTVHKRWPLLLLMLLSLGILGYFHTNMERLQMYVGFPMPLDVIAGYTLVFIVLWACRISFGIALPTVSVCMMLYGFLAHYFGGPKLGLNDIINTVCLTFGGYDMFGKILHVSANVIFLFMLYSGILQCLRATDFFTELGKVVGRYTRSGPAMTAVVSSALMGMISGQATPNIAVTGAFTIPLMKKVGYKPEVAGSIEAGASMGGQIMPPIMGASAFVMADLLGVSYLAVIAMAAVPAILYFFSVATFVHLHALKSKVMPINERADIRRLCETGPLFLAPLLVILLTLFRGYPPMAAAFWGILSLLLVTFIRKGTRPSLNGLVAGCIRGAVVGSQIAVATAVLGTIISLVTKTGLGLKIGFSVEAWSGGNIFLALVILMATIIVLGMEVPTLAAYLIAAIVAIPSLVRLGLNPHQAHMFAFFFASSAGLTPPVGMAAVVASKLADAPYIKTALHAVNAAAAAYLLPFVFVFNGALLLLPGTKLLMVIISIVIVLLGLVIFQIGFVGYFFERLVLWERPLMILSGLGILFFAARGTYPALMVSAILLLPVILRQINRKRQVS